ncbi:MAG: YraN family protein [Clostridiales bacterium]|nr:YraN family protein [Clostridiales bacterium]
MNTRKIGANKEEVACRYLEENGIRIKQRNFRCRSGEIDVIGYDGEYLVFFEVKYRKSGSDKGSALEAVGFAKQKKICRVADYYRMIHRCPADTPIRFDVVAIDGDDIQWVKNAFEYA